jgi:hypothetical protein
MIDCGAQIMKKKPAVIEAIEEQLRLRLRDVETDVRQAALNRLFELGLESPQYLKAETIEQVGRWACLGWLHPTPLS